MIAFQIHPHKSQGGVLGLFLEGKIQMDLMTTNNWKISGFNHAQD
jgi:hypothetical protein